MGVSSYFGDEFLRFLTAEFFPRFATSHRPEAPMSVDPAVPLPVRTLARLTVCLTTIYLIDKLLGDFGNMARKML